MRKAIMIAAALLCGCAEPETQEEQPAMSDDFEVKAPVVSEDHEGLLASTDPKLAANKRLVYDMYRIVLQAGLADRAGEFIAEGYVQHNPNAAQGLAGLVEYVRSTRPEREIEDALELPLIHLMAEGDFVATTFVRPEQDANGKTYYSSWFDLYRIKDGKIVEHWDPALKTDARIDPNQNRLED